MSPGNNRFLWVVLGMTALLCMVRPGRSLAVSLLTDPPNGSVVIEGKLKVTGTAPIPLDGLEAGSYRLKLAGPGVFNSIGRLSLDPGHGQVSLHDYAGPASLLYPPGLGFRRQGSPFRGSIFFLGAVAGVAGGFEAAFDIRNAEDDLALAQNAYAKASTEEEAAVAREAVLYNNDVLNDERQMRGLWTAYAAYWWLGAAVETWLLTPKPSLTGGGSSFTVAAAPASGMGAALRSALVPGSGQRFLGHEGRGNLVAGGIALFGAGGLAAHSSYLKARREQDRVQRLYDAAESPEAAVTLFGELVRAQDDARDKDRVRLVLFGATALTYLWNVIDAAGMGSDKSDLTRFSWNVVPTSEGLLAAMTWRIS